MPVEGPGRTLRYVAIQFRTGKLCSFRRSHSQNRSHHAQNSAVFHQRTVHRSFGESLKSLGRAFKNLIGVPEVSVFGETLAHGHEEEFGYQIGENSVHHFFKVLLEFLRRKLKRPFYCQ